MEEFERDCCILSYHVHKEIWQASIGEELEYDREPENWYDCYAVAVKRIEVVIGHLPQKLLCICSLFLIWRKIRIIVFCLSVLNPQQQTDMMFALTHLLYLARFFGSTAIDHLCNLAVCSRNDLGDRLWEKGHLDQAKHPWAWNCFEST